MPLTPYTGPFGRPELMHLLRRTLFGVSPADMAHFNGMSLTQVVNALLTFTNTTTPPLKAYSLPDANQVPDPTLVDPGVTFGTTWVDTPFDLTQDPFTNAMRMLSFRSWWMGQLIHQDRTLREKMTLFWQHAISTESDTIQLSDSAYRLNQKLRTQCLGNFRQLIHDVTIDAGMLVYLNGYLNNAFAPDENYARELMELFTLGEGSGYTEADVQQAARVLTGWTLQLEQLGQPILPTVVYLPFLHDAGNKTFSAFFNNTVIQGQPGPGGGEAELTALLDMLFAKEELSRHICRKLYRFFIHSEIDATVENDFIEPLAELFRNNVGAPDQLRIVMQALLTSDRFFSADVRACMINSPVDFAVGKLRQLGMPMPTPAQFEAQYRIWMDVYNVCGFAQQELADPPNVAGWPAYHQFPQYDRVWMDSSSYAFRKLIYEYVSFIGLSTPAQMVQPQSQNLVFKIHFPDFVSQFANPANPNTLLSEACEYLMAVPVSQQVRDQLKLNYLLFGQTNDLYWTYAWSTYAADPNTTDPAGSLVPTILLLLFLDLQSAAEHHLH